MDRLYPLTITTPPNTAVITPLSTAWRLEDAKLVSVTIVIPDGHAGLTGIRILQAGQQIVPYDNNAYFVSNNEIVEVPVNGEITATGVVVVTYNTDVFQHSHYLRALVTSLNSSDTTVAPPIDAISADILSGPFGL